MKLKAVTSIIFAAAVYSACTNPIWDIESDPPPHISAEERSDLIVLADEQGRILLHWPPTHHSVDGYIVEKKLGGSGSYTIIATLDSTAFTFEDTSREVRRDTYYRTTGYVEEGSAINHIIRFSSRLDFGYIVNATSTFDASRRRIVYTWNGDAPFMTHFEITSSHIFNDTGDKTTTIPATGTPYTFVDRMSEIDFNRRVINVTGFIIGEGFRDSITSIDIPFESEYIFSPTDISVQTYNNKHWSIAWRNITFFGDGIRIFRLTGGLEDEEVLIADLPPHTISYVDTTSVVTLPTTYFLEAYMKDSVTKRSSKRVPAHIP